MPYPRSYEDQHPGNECMFYRKWGATMEDVDIKPENAPRITNVMIEALAWHNCQQKEARDHQEYQWQLDSTALPRATLPPPRTTDRDVITELDSALLGGVEGTTVPIPENKKITLGKYNHHKALKLQKKAASPDNLDENGERLDYDDFEPEDNPDNIQIDYQMPAPSPQTSIPPLEDTPISTSPATTQSLVGASPSAVPSTMEHTSTAANQAPGFGRGLPVQTMPIRVGAPQDSTSPMQVGTPHSLSLLLPTSSPARQITPMQVASLCQMTTATRTSASTTPMEMSMPKYSSKEASGLTSTAEDELLKGTTLPCSPW